MKKLAASALVAALVASASLASAQTTSNQNLFSRMPMFSFWGSQATTTTTPMTVIAGTQTQGQTAPASTNTSFQDFWAQMPMFQFFNFSQ